MGNHLALGFPLDCENSMSEVIVIGASIAGLACTIRLAEMGISSICINASRIGLPRVCGEFISGESLPILKQWGIEPDETLTSIRLITPKQEAKLQLKTPAGSMRRERLEQELATVAKSLGVDIREELPVKSIQSPNKEGDNFRIVTDSEVFIAKQIVVSSGRIALSNQTAPPDLPYIGMNIHLPRSTESDLAMHTFPGGYLGISPVDDTTLNCALLARKGSDIASVLKELNLPDAEEWLFTQVPSFGRKPLPSSSNTYLVGDAYTTVPPATGAGLSNALHSGSLAAEHIAHGNSLSFYRAMHSATRSQNRWGKILHNIFISPSASSTAIFIQKQIPALGSFLYNKTRVKIRKKKRKAVVG